MRTRWRVSDFTTVDRDSSKTTGSGCLSTLSEACQSRVSTIPFQRRNVSDVVMAHTDHNVLDYGLFVYTNRKSSAAVADELSLSACFTGLVTDQYSSPRPVFCAVEKQGLLRLDPRVPSQTVPARPAAGLTESCLQNSRFRRC